MGKDTAIAYTHHTFNPWWGCERVSPGCDHCYAADWAHRFGWDVWGKDAPRRLFGEAHWKEPLSWNRAARAAGVRRRVFGGSMCDVFERRDDLVVPRDELWDLIEQTTALDWLLLTKRPQHILTGIYPHWIERLPPNVWLGTTIENQHAAEHRLRYLRKDDVPAQVTFASCEPLLGDLSLRREDIPEWVIIGAESGAQARPLHLAWVRSIIAQCRAAGAAVFVKQLGQSYYEDSPGGQRRRVILRDAKGADPAEWPEDLRIQEFPKAA